MAVAPAFASRSALLACTLVFGAPASAVKAQDIPIVLAPHRAVYDLALGQTRENAQIVGVRGRILYDFDGNACDGYTLQFRQVSELDSGEGKISTSDLRSTTWEGGDAKRFKFTSQNFLDQKLVDSVDGHAEHGAAATAVDLAKPEHKVLDIDAAAVFPTQHMVRVIAAARAVLGGDGGGEDRPVPALQRLAAPPAPRSSAAPAWPTTPTCRRPRRPWKTPGSTCSAPPCARR